MGRVRRLGATCAARLRAFREGRRPRVTVGRGVRLGPGVRCAAAPGGEIVVAEGAEIGGHTVLTAQAGAVLHVAERAFIAGYCTIAAARRVVIGPETMIAEMVSIRDHDHDPAYPPLDGHKLVGELMIGPRVWIGAKASVVRGCQSIGADAVVGAHALVNRPVPAASLVAGVPAQVKRHDVRRPA